MTRRPGSGSWARGDVDALLSRHIEGNDTSRRLRTIPGVGEIVATTIYAGVGDIRRFPNGQDSRGTGSTPVMADPTASPPRSRRLAHASDHNLAAEVGARPVAETQP